MAAYQSLSLPRLLDDSKKLINSRHWSEQRQIPFIFSSLYLGYSFERYNAFCIAHSNDSAEMLGTAADHVRSGFYHNFNIISFFLFTFWYCRLLSAYLKICSINLTFSTFYDKSNWSLRFLIDYFAAICPFDHTFV